MPKYRIYLSDGRKVDVEAHEHQTIPKESITVEFIDNTGKVVASFSRPALQGYVKIDNLVSETN